MEIILTQILQNIVLEVLPSPFAASVIIRTHRTQYIVILMTKMYYSEGVQRKVSKGKTHGVKSKRNQCSFSKSSPRGITQDSILLAMSCDMMCEIFSTREAYQKLSAYGFHRQPLSSIVQNASLPEGNQIFSINHIVCTNSLGTLVLMSIPKMVRTLPKFKFPDASEES